MRNSWYPKGMAAYMTAAQLRTVDGANIMTERDTSFGLLKKRAKQARKKETPETFIKEIELTLLSVSLSVLLDNHPMPGLPN